MLKVHFYEPRYSNTYHNLAFGRPYAIRQNWHQKDITEVIKDIEYELGRKVKPEELSEIEKYIKLIKDGWTVYLVNETERRVRT